MNNDEMTPEEAATLKFQGEQNGVRWYIRQDGKFNRTHIFLMEGQRVEGGWVSGSYVFRLFASLSSARRVAWLQARKAGLPAGEIGALRPPKNTV